MLFRSLPDHVAISHEESKSSHELNERNLLAQLLEGVVQMHAKGVFHRDIKTDNLLMVDGVLKFVDFGISKLSMDETKMNHTKNVVTRCYRPPEIFFGDRNYNLGAVDIWSVGCVIAELVTGHVLFPGTSDIEQLSLIFDVLGTPTTEDWPEVDSLPCFLPF